MIILIQAENGRCPKIDLSVNGSKIKHIIDTGTNLNIIIPRDTYKSMKIKPSLNETHIRAGFNATEPVPILGDS